MKKVLIVILAFLVLIIVFVSCIGNDDEPTATPEPEATEAPAEVTPTSLVAGVVGDKTNHSEEEFANPIIDVSINGEALNIKLIGNDNLSTSYIRSMMLKRACEIYETAFDEFPDINLTYIEWHYPLVDTYGNVELSSVMTIDLTRETADKINWENFLTDNLPGVADSYWQHGAMN